MFSVSTGEWKMLLDMYPACPPHAAKSAYSEEEKDAARLAAASYYQNSSDYINVVKEYCRLARKDYSEDMYALLLLEILTVLPPYRYPGPDGAIFMADPGTCKGTAYQPPYFLQEIKGVVNDDLLQSIKEYVQAAEDDKLRLSMLEEENTAYKRIFDKVSEIKGKSYDRPEKKYADMARIIGLSAGVRHKAVADRDLYFDYLCFVKWHGQKRIEALESVRKKRNLGGTKDALVRRLNKYRTKVIYSFYDEKHPTISKRIRTLMKGFIPSSDYVKQFE